MGAVIWWEEGGREVSCSYSGLFCEDRLKSAFGRARWVLRMCSMKGRRVLTRQL